MSHLADAAALRTYLTGGTGAEAVRAALSEGQVQVSSVTAATVVGRYPTGSAGARKATLLLQSLVQLVPFTPEDALRVPAAPDVEGAAVLATARRLNLTVLTPRAELAAAAEAAGIPATLIGAAP
ncbi:hypothetical protein GCM10008959_23620 [Deinococcus seoulensis]|uniref:PIN domain-containing protein n=1 Tax=Deinococcus seoulensis TaxID=1837379 RepID=A0ABQ2RVL3_9DEIO|nr:hypothetical protein [Deinococcus seoulensis]GGR61012.1 hypothetical protein GCM10008959_23620 [Deinococcus seoulensis]